MRNDIDAASFGGGYRTNEFRSVNIEGKSTTTQYKDTFFRTLFKDPDKALSLYNALVYDDYSEGTNIVMVEPNEIMAKFNDISFLIDDRLVVFIEHQSTINNNMPLRMLMYIHDALARLVDSTDIYMAKRIEIPTPEVYVLYNGKHKLKDEVLRLSDSYKTKLSNVCLELVVPIIDIRYPSLYNSDRRISNCQPLLGYSYLVDCIRMFKESGYSRDLAIKYAIDSCIENNILTDFLIPEYKEVMDMLSREYDFDKHMQAMVKQGEATATERITKMIDLHAAGKSVAEICQETDCDEKYIRRVLGSILKDE